MATLRDLEDVLAQGLGDLTPVRRQAVLKNLADHEVSEAVAAELGRASEDLVDDLCRLGGGPGAAAVAMVDGPEHGAAAEAVSRGLEAEALQLPEDEGAEVRRHNIQDLLNHVVGVAVGQGVAHVTLEWGQERLGTVHGNVVRFPVLPRRGVADGVRRQAHGLLYRRAARAALAGQLPGACGVCQEILRLLLVGGGRAAATALVRLQQLRPHARRRRHAKRGDARRACRLRLASPEDEAVHRPGGLDGQAVSVVRLRAGQRVEPLLEGGVLDQGLPPRVPHLLVVNRGGSPVPSRRQLKPLHIRLPPNLGRHFDEALHRRRRRSGGKRVLALEPRRAADFCCRVRAVEEGAAPDGCRDTLIPADHRRRARAPQGGGRGEVVLQEGVFYMKLVGVAGALLGGVGGDLRTQVCLHAVRNLLAPPTGLVRARQPADFGGRQQEVLPLSS
mmetsp:Transcript_52056/g.153551  ORF Transcript_52056/g.153551 Transcript_52056/m.153551 type:complete len:446 (-) Transcript_52056:435-1772(-)